VSTVNVSPALLEALLHGEVWHIPALPFQRKDFYADIALITDRGSTKVIAEGFDLPTEEEVFYLNLDGFDPNAYWIDEGGKSAWPPELDGKGGWTAFDIATALKETGLADVLCSNRTVQFYRHPEAARSGIGSRGLFGSSAIALTSKTTGQCVVIYAAPDLACSVQVTWDQARISEILSKLEAVE
jgi:hypothetical protein